MPLRVIIVLALSIWTMSTTLPALAALWIPQATIGLRADYDGRIMRVDPSSPAARAGITGSDRIDLMHTPARDRIFAAPSAPPPRLNETVELAVLRDGVEKFIRLVPETHVLSAAEKWSIVARIFDMLVYVVVGATLILLRPSRATWGFFLSCLGINFPQPASLGFFSHDWALAILIAGHALFAAGATGFLIFGLRFPRDEIAGWRSKLERNVSLIFIITLALFIWPDIAAQILGIRSEAAQVVALAWGAAIALTVVGALYSTYREGSAEDRQRIRWVIVGFAIGVTAGISAGVLGYSSLVPMSSSAVLVNLLIFLSVSIPVTVAYAVIKHRVLDVRFAISRALVYAIMTTGAVVIFGIIDWFFAHVLAAAGVALVLEILASIAIGFVLDTVGGHIDTLVDKIFFRRRHAADQRLERVTASLPTVASEQAVDNLIVEEPVAAWQLSSGAIFRRAKDGTFTRRAEQNLPDSALVSIDQNDPLPLQLQAAASPLSTADIGGSNGVRKSGIGTAALALPILTRKSLLAIVLYGAPLSGGDFDPDQRAILRSLASAAAATYEHLEAEALRRRVAELERLLELLPSEPSKTRSVATPEV